jgi:hypothetical protein
MLTPFKLNNGDEVWVNPIHVRYVRPDRGMLGGDRGTEICFGAGSTTNLNVTVVHSPRDVAEALNRAMPAVLDINQATEEDQKPRKSDD